MGSQSYPKIIPEGPFQAGNDACKSFDFRSDGPRTIQWNMLAFIVDIFPNWLKILKFLWQLQFFQI